MEFDGPSHFLEIPSGWSNPSPPLLILPPLPAVVHWCTGVLAVGLEWSGAQARAKEFASDVLPARRFLLAGVVRAAGHFLACGMLS